MSVAYTVDSSVRPDRLKRLMELLSGVLDTTRTQLDFVNESPTRIWKTRACCTKRGATTPTIVAVQLQRPHRGNRYTLRSGRLCERIRHDRSQGIGSPDLSRADDASSPQERSLRVAGPRGRWVVLNW